MRMTATSIRAATLQSTRTPSLNKILLLFAITNMEDLYAVDTSSGIVVLDFIEFIELSRIVILRRIRTL